MHKHPTRSTAFLVACALASLPAALSAQTFPANYTSTLLATGLSFPTAMAVAPNGDVYICQQGGALKVWQSGVGVTTVATFTVDSAGERGLIGVALDPAFATNRFVYVHYTRPTPSPHNNVNRITLNAAGTAIVPFTEVTLLAIDNLSGATNHNGGAIHFGIDGKLYVGVGENASSSNSQTVANLKGKLLRLNPDPASPIPADNPTTFAGIAGSPTGNNRAIFAVGLRNPFTFGVHPVTGRIFIDDVGENTWEEINDGLPGRNYGWPTTEGFFTQSSFPNLTEPLIAYNHSNGAANQPAAIGSFVGHAIIGGAFYVPAPGVNANFPISFSEDYFFGDEVNSFIRTYDPAAGNGAGFATGIGGVVDIALAPNSTLLYLAGAGGSGGSLNRVTYTGTSGVCCTGATCALSNGLNCAAPGVFTWGTVSCTPAPCVAATGACCCGATCSISTSAACTGPTSAFTGANTACNAAGNNIAPCCKADFNHASGISVQDIFDFLAAYFANDPCSDISQSGGISTQDIFDFLAAYFTSCP